MGHDPLAVVYAAAEELRASSNYFFDNSRRRDANCLVIQRTVAGTGFFADSAARQLVPPETAMVFTLREPTSYGYPVEATESYRFRFIAMTPTPSLLALAKWLRRDFGSVVRLPADSEVGEVFEEVFKRFKAHTFRDRFHESEMLSRLFLALFREQVHRTRTSDPIEFGHHYLRDHFRAPINLKTIAAKIGVSREYFIRMFSERFGETPGALLRRLRMEHAHAMLGATAVSVEDVALASGFTRSNSFCRAYRRVYGTTPSASRDTPATATARRGKRTGA